MKYIVMYSGGVTSFEAARRAIELYGRDSVELWFADTNSEDPDLYRFNCDVERVLGVEVQVFADGRDLWQLFRDQRMMANTRVDLCSRILKRDLLRRELRRRFPDPSDATVILGMDYMEDCDRIERAGAAQAPYAVWFPLLDEPWMTKAEIIAWLEQRGVAAPALYAAGAPHNNCGGFCVKAGLGQFAWLLEVFPERYAYHEEQERRFRRMVGKNVSILRDRRKGHPTVMTLERFRHRVEAGQHFPMRRMAACQCFVDKGGDEE